MKDYKYNVFGLIIQSEIKLPELPKVEDQESNVWIKIGKVPDHLPLPAGSGVLYEASQDDFLLRLNNVAKYRVQNGKNITVEPSKNSTPQEIRLFLFGSVMGALLHQRSLLAIHGSCISKGNRGIIFTGKSSAGKSTLAAGLHAKGYSVVTDDIAVVDTDKDEKHIILPGVPQIKLWKDVLNQLNEKSILTKVRFHFEKYYLPIQSLETSGTIFLDKIIFLTTKNTPGYHFSEVVGSEKFNILRENTYRIQYVDKFNRLEDHFKNISQLASTIQLFKVERPFSPLQLKYFADFIEKKIFNI